MSLNKSMICGAGASLAFASLAFAQVVVPPLCEHTDGGGNTARHVFGDSAFRSQHVVLGSFLTSQPNWTGAVTGISFRPDSGIQSIGAPNGGTFTDVKVFFSYTAFEPTTLTDTFATNRDQPQVLVYDCTATGSDPDIVVRGAPFVE